MITLGQTTDAETVSLNTKDFTTHAAVIGATGSGKSGLLLGLIEQFNDSDIPIIVVDIKGDMINVALTDTWKRNVRCLTPGAVHGEAVNVLADLGSGCTSSTVSALLSMIDEDPDPLRSNAHAYLSSIISNSDGRIRLNDLVYECQNPSFYNLGALSLDEAFPKRQRSKLAQKLNTLLVSDAFKAWRVGSKLCIDDIVNRKGITVYSVAHLLNESERSFAISFLLEQLTLWMRQQPGSKDLRLALVIDECLGLLPPHPHNPPTKASLMLLLKQARAFGVGCLLATQNPVDLDYKALSNCQTWMIGRLTTSNDQAKVVKGMNSGSMPKELLYNSIAKLKPREFFVYSPKAASMFRTRDVACNLVGPMVPSEVEKLYDDNYIHFGSRLNALAAFRARVSIEGKPEDIGRVAHLESILFPEPVVNQVIEEVLGLPDREESEEITIIPTPCLNLKESAVLVGVLGLLALTFVTVFNYFLG